MRRAAGERDRGGGAQPGPGGGIGIGLLEEPEAELDAEDARHGRVDQFNGDRAVPDGGEELVAETEAVGCLHVDAGPERLAAGLERGGGDPVEGVQHLDGAEVGDGEALEAEFAAEDVGQQEAGGVQRHAVEFAVGGHQREGASLADGGGEGREIELAKFALARVDRPEVDAAFGRTVGAVVLGRGGDPLGLQGADVGDAQPRGQERILAVVLLDAAPAGITGKVEVRRVGLGNARGAGLAPDGRGHLRH